LSKQRKQKVVQYLNEAHASELALVRQLQVQIAMAPRGSYRDGLEAHLQETRVWASWGRATTRCKSGWAPSSPSSARRSH
jgi:hypothetical protein